MSQDQCYWTSVSDEKLHVVFLNADELVSFVGKKKHSSETKNRLAQGDLNEKKLKGAVRIPRNDLISVENQSESDAIMPCRKPYRPAD